MKHQTVSTVIVVTMVTKFTTIMGKIVIIQFLDGIPKTHSL